MARKPVQTGHHDSTFVASPNTQTLKASVSQKADALRTDALSNITKAKAAEKNQTEAHKNVIKYTVTSPDPVLAAEWKAKEEQYRKEAAYQTGVATVLYNRAREIEYQVGMDVEKVIYPKAKIDKAPSKKDKATGGTPQDSKKSEYKGIYVYNLPMVKSAYFSHLPSSPQAQSAGMKTSDPVDYKRAQYAWDRALEAGGGARGAIQMDRYLSTNIQARKSKKGETTDKQMYGFRFLYNPNEVQMTWGLQTEMHPDYIAGGFDKGTPFAQGLLASTISFSLMLNRIEDMKYLDKNGLIRVSGNSDVYLEERLQRPSLIDNPYPTFTTPDDSELRLIYKKGTMYDVEYLLKTIMGKNATYTSNLNGDTADWGWLNAAPVELHLGDGLRYRVRINGMSITHGMFNARMVPILSTLNLSCSRFYDGGDIANFTEIPPTSSKTTPAPGSTRTPGAS